MATISDNVNHSPEDEIPHGESMFSPDDESIWKRYNANYEFPLSIATSVVLHIFVCLMVAIAGVWLFNFGTGAPPDLEAISFGGGGGAGEGAGDPNGPETLQEAVTLNQETQDQQPQIKIDTDMLSLDTNDPNKRLLQEARDTDQQLAKGVNDPSKLAGDIGRGGPGRGGGKGSGFGRGDGDGVGDGKGNARTRRKDRWEISLPMQDSAQFVKKLGELESILMIPDGPGKFKLYDMTQRNPEGKPATIIDINKMNRIWYTNRVQIVCQGIADELGLSARPDFFAIFIPQTLEQEMFKKELAYRHLTEEELDRRKMVTKFEVNKRGSGWDVRVRSQDPRPN